MKRKPLWGRLAFVSALLFAAGCEDCEVGTFWCEDDAVMICVPEEDDDDDWATSYDDDSGSWVDLIASILEIADAAEGEGRSEVYASCAEQELVCVEKTDAYTGETEAVCDWDLDW